MRSFRTEIIPKPLVPGISHTDGIVAMGSCFAENISDILIHHRFNCHVNSHGIVFNPFSLALAIEEVMSLKKYSEDNLRYENDLWLSMSHHGRFSDADKNVVLSSINDSILGFHQYLQNAKYLLITFGSAWFYRLRENNTIVANCHKLPGNAFDKELARHPEITEQWSRLFQDLKKFNPELKIILTVSPVRHWRDGAVENQLSKANLIIAANNLTQQFDHVHYFPAYEIMIDDLRDYRFYNDDMIHPSTAAIEYIWEKFVDTCLTPRTKELVLKLKPLLAFLNHRPMKVSAEKHAVHVQSKELEIVKMIVDFSNS